MYRGKAQTAGARRGLVGLVGEHGSEVINITSRGPEDCIWNIYVTGVCLPGFHTKTCSLEKREERHGMQHNESISS